MPTTPPYLRVHRSHERTIVVGDVHGCFDELRQVFRLVGFSERDVLVCVGDLVDRGPKSKEVLQFFRDTPNAFSAFGNHDRRLAGTVRGTSRPAWSQLQTLATLPETEWSAWATFLEGLPAVVETDHAIVTHGRLDPTRPLEEQEPYFTAAVGGAAVSIALDTQGVPEWFSQGRWHKPVCIGHLEYDRAELAAGGLFALDTGAARGGCLTGLVLPDLEVVAVTSPVNYHDEAFEAWTRHTAIAAGPVEDRPLSELASARRRWSGHDVDALWLSVSAGVDELRGRLLAVNDALTLWLGPLPLDGPAKGEFYRRLKHDLETPVLTRLAALVRHRDAPDLFDRLARSLPRASLHGLIEAADDLVAKLAKRGGSCPP